MIIKDIHKANKDTVSAVAYFITKGNFLPRLQPGKMFRWDYDYVEVGESRDAVDAYALADIDEEGFRPVATQPDSDEWTVGSSSSFSSTSRSPSMGARSPTDETWEGETLASDSEYQKP